VVEILRQGKRAWAVWHDRYGAQKPSAALARIERRLAAEEIAAAQTGQGESRTRLVCFKILGPVRHSGCDPPLKAAPPLHTPNV
jgi:hypothetical protein